MPEEMKLFAERILAPVGAKAGRLPVQELTGFLAVKGRLYDRDRELMIVGRAVNGWVPRRNVLPNCFANVPFRNQYATEVLQASGHSPYVNAVQGQCPMNWVYIDPPNGFNANKSSFWRVSRQVTGRLRIANVNKRNWPSHLVWSNLYKLSPWEGGNPDTTLRCIQQAGCVALFQLEIDIYRPRRLLLIAEKNGAPYGDWYRATDPFLDGLNVPVNMANGIGGQHVRRAGYLAFPDGEHTHFVDARRPEGQPENAWTKEVVQAFQQL